MPNFEFDVTLAKADVTEEAPDAWRFIGLASTGCRDRQNERISEKAVASMNRQARSTPICMASTHEEAMYNPLSEVGIVDDVDESEPDKLVVRGFWDKMNPNAAFVHSRLNNPDHPPGWKLSIGGKIRPSDTRMDFDSEGPVRIIDDMILDHIYLCRGGAAVNQETSIAAMKADASWTEAIFKAASSIPDEPEAAHCAEVDDCVSEEKASFSETPWGEVDKTKLPASCFLYVGDPEKKSTWKFPVYEGAGEMDSEGMYTSRGPLNVDGLASAAGYLSSTDPEVRSVVEPKLQRLYAEINKELPPSLKGKAEEEPSMPDLKATLDAIRQLLSGGEVEPVEDAAKAETEAEPVVEEPAVEETVAVEDAPAVEYVSKAAFDEVVSGVDAKIESLKGEILAAIEKAATPEEGAEDPIAVLKAEYDGKFDAFKAEVVAKMDAFDAVATRLGKAADTIEAALGAEGTSTQPEAPVQKASVEDVDVFDILGDIAARHADWLD